MELPIIMVFYVCIHISIDTIGIASSAFASLVPCEYSWVSIAKGMERLTVMENRDDLTENLVSLILITREYTEGAL